MKTAQLSKSKTAKHSLTMCILLSLWVNYWLAVVEQLMEGDITLKIQSSYLRELPNVL